MKGMDYQETLRFLYESLPMYQRTGAAAYKANLDTTLALDRYFGHPHRNFPSVHVAGTNGKGSVSHLLASVLQESGRRTGLYTSPHLLDFRERIRVGGAPVPEKEVCRFVNDHRAIIDETAPSFFEMTVAMAFDWFSRDSVDAAVIEVGMGGRLDSTNILYPALSVITNISLDHTRFLGPDIPSIAAEKGGIIKPGIPVVLGPMVNEAEEVLTGMAAASRSPVYLARENLLPGFQTIATDGTALFHLRQAGSGGTETFPCGLSGRYQGENLSTVLTSVKALNELGWNIDPEQVRRGLASVVHNTGIMGRFQVIGSNPRSICDCAHNPAGVAVLMEDVLQIPFRKLHIVWGMVGDKDREAILKLLPDHAAYYFSEPDIPRALPAGQLQKEASEHGLKGRSYPTVNEAYQAARSAADPRDLILTGGSTFTVAGLLGSLGY